MGIWWKVCGGGDLLEKSSGWWTPAEAVWQRISLIPLQLEAPFLWPVSPDVSENWRKKCSFKNSLWSCWWELGKARYTHCQTHTQSHHAMAYSLTVLKPSCISIRSANKIMYISVEGCVGGRVLVDDKKKRSWGYQYIKCVKQLYWISWHWITALNWSLCDNNKVK